MKASATLLGAGLLAVGTVLLAGCGNDGPDRYRISGQVTWQGKPVPAGMVTFTPDVSKGNSGPQGAAPIRSGRYDTSDTEGRDAVSGPHIIVIYGYDGKEPNEINPLGTRLFPEHQLERDLSKEDATLDLTVP